MVVCVSAVLVPTGSIDGSPQQNGGDIGSSVIGRLPASVSAQCKLIVLLLE